MMHLLLLTAFLVGLLPRGTCAPLGEDQPLEPTTVSLHESCREPILQRAASALLHQLRLDQPPGIAADAASRAREAWAREAASSAAPQAAGQSLNVSSNQTLLIQRGCCVQISRRITLDDLGWQSWVLFPDSFVFTQCLGCSCRSQEERPPLPLWLHGCALGRPSQWPELDTKQRHCCRPRRSSQPFVFLQADGSLVVRAARMVQDCHGRP